MRSKGLRGNVCGQEQVVALLDSSEMTEEAMNIAQESSGANCVCYTCAKFFFSAVVIKIKPSLQKSAEAA
jgi:hypothetical protein